MFLCDTGDTQVVHRISWFVCSTGTELSLARGLDEEEDLCTRLSALTLHSTPRFSSAWMFARTEELPEQWNVEG